MTVKTIKQIVSTLFQVSICAVGYLCATSSTALAQVTSDGTVVNTQVNQNENVAEITGGETKGGNLFHSFQDFSVPTGNEAFFDNANDIDNIFSRVTGGNISNIDGAIRANGSANLFLINPAGIIFSENARLDLGGSFYGSTASSILFEDGKFSAADLENPPLLTVNAPIGLGFRDEPGDIVNRSFVQNSAEEFVGLEVSPGQTLALVGGNINFEVGEITARGGNIRLGGLSQAGTVGLDPDGSLSFPANITLSDITLTNSADVDVTGSGGGSVTINAQNLSLESGDFGSSLIRSGIRPESTNPEAQAGDIEIDVAENIRVNGSGIVNQVSNDEETNTIGRGNSGNITINTGSLILTNGGSVDANTFGQGDAGAVEVTASGNIIADGENPAGSQSSIASLVNSDAVGNSGGVKITATNLNLTNGGRIIASTLGQGDAGAVEVTVTGDIIADGENSAGFPSAITSQVNSDAVGNSGEIKVITANLSLVNGGRITASTLGQGDAGAVEVTATGDITAEGENSESIPSGITSQVNPDATGNSGGVRITTTNLNLNAGGQVAADTLGQGNAGAVEVAATGDITAEGEDSEGLPSSITSGVSFDATGDSGGVRITTTNLNLNAGGRIASTTFGRGNANNVNITATESISIDGSIELFRSGISANALNGNGNGGNILVNTGELTIANGGTIEATNFDNINNDSVPAGTGKSGTITINANSVALDNARIEAATQFTGEASGIIELLVAENISLRNNSFISARAFNDADGGNLNIDSRFIVAFPNSNNDIVANAQKGNGGDITINAESLLGIAERSLSNSTNDINASSELSLDGNVTIRTPDINPVRGATELPSNVVEPEETTAQACAANRDRAAKNGLTVSGKGGIIADPALPLNSLNTTVNGETNPTSTVPSPIIKTSQGEIQPAKGIKVTKSGEVILTAYRTNNSGDRPIEINPNCDRNKVSIRNKYTR